MVVTAVGIEPGPPAYKPCLLTTTLLQLTKACFNEFIPFEEDEIRTIIGSMPSKSCELDPIPTKLFKKILLVPLQTIAVIVNISFKEGVFALDWKTAIIQSVIEKTWYGAGKEKLQASKQSQFYV